MIILSVFAIANAGKRTKSNEANTSTSDIVSDQAKADNTLSYEDADDENVGKAESKEESQSNEQKSSGKRGAEGSVPSNLDIDGFNKGTNSYTVDRLTEDTTIAEAEQAEAPEPRDSTESMLPEAEKQDPKLYKDEMKTLGITLRLQNVRSTGCVLMFTREEDTKEETGTIFTSPEYEIEKWNGSSWEIYPHVKEVIFDDEQWALVKGKVNTYVADWWLDYGSLVGGKYRVIKMLYTDRDYDGYDEFRIAAEFEIN